MELIESTNKIAGGEFMVECTCHCSLLTTAIKLTVKKKMIDEGSKNDS